MLHEWRGRGEFDEIKALGSVVPDSSSVRIVEEVVSEIEDVRVVGSNTIRGANIVLVGFKEVVMESIVLFDAIVRG